VGFANDDAAIEFALRERESRVRAGVLHREDLSVHCVETDIDSFYADAKASISRDFFDLCNRDEGHECSECHLNESSR
jgi:hypothetical protein